MAERFIREYASYKTKMYKDLLRSFPEKNEYTDEKLERIRKIVEGRNRSLITVNEAMKLLTEV